MFSIGDLQAEDEFDDPESEGEGEVEEDSNVVYPIRASLSITKVDSTPYPSRGILTINLRPSQLALVP